MLLFLFAYNSLTLVSQMITRAMKLTPNQNTQIRTSAKVSFLNWYYREPNSGPYRLAPHSTTLLGF